MSVTDAKIEAAIVAYWREWTLHHERMGMRSMAAMMLNRPGVEDLNRACMRAALLAAESTSPRKVVPFRQTELTADQWDRIGEGYCPDCDHRGFVLGPRGGAAINIECGNVECRSRFNVVAGVFNHAGLIYVERLPSEAMGGNKWEPRSR